MESVIAAAWTVTMSECCNPGRSCRGLEGWGSGFGVGEIAGSGPHSALLSNVRMLTGCF
jgi:hypothetical protein